MRRLFGLLIAAALCLPVGASAWWQSIQQVGVAGGGASYSGPGDAVSGAIAWWGLRAYSLATVSTKSANICNSGDANCADVNTLANGNFDVATATGAPLNCGGAGGTCTVKTLYDKSTGNKCGGGVCDITQATIANRPTLVFSCNGSLPCMAFGGTTAHLSSASFASTAVPYTILVAANRMAATTSLQAGLRGNNPGIYYNNAANQVVCFDGGSFTTPVSATDNAWHVLQAAFRTGTNNLNCSVDGGTSNSALTGSFAGAAIDVFGDAFSQGLNGRAVEAGVWPTEFTTQLGTMSTNIHSYWGF